MSISVYGLDAARPHPRVSDHPATIYLDFDDPAFMNWSGVNADTMLALLGLSRGGSPVIGQVTVAEARRAIIRGRAMFDRRAPALERPTEIAYGRPRALSDGTVALRPVRRMSFGLDLEGMRVRLDAFERAVEALAIQGATHIAWA